MITGLIADEVVRTGRFDFLRFYERRARRILPALFVVVAFSVIIGWLYLNPVLYKSLLQCVIGVAAFISNIVLYGQVDYFDAASEHKLLLHTWSLAVEEQFYLLFPVVVLLVYKGKWMKPFHAFSLLCVVSLSLFIIFYDSIPSAVFYLLPFRAWELLVGSLAAIISISGAPKVSDVKANYFSLLGLAIVLGSIIALTDDFASSGPALVFPVLGSFLVILFSRRGGVVFKALSMPVFVGIGLISYSVYLWHQPIMALYRIISVEEMNFVSASILSALSIVFGYA